MSKYVAFLRGIGPGNPNMRNDKLREVFESLGFENVQTVISSGNVIFESPESDAAKLEKQIETALPAQLGFESTTIIRSHDQLAKLLQTEPFKGLVHGTGSYLLITFFKHPTKVDFDFPYEPEGKPYKLLGATDEAVYTVTDNTIVKTTDLMTWLEKQFGKEISSRTLNTVERIFARMSS